MQVSLAFRWPPAFVQQYQQLCEWSKVPGMTVEEIIAVLDEIYAAMPADRVPGLPDEEFPEPGEAVMSETLF